MFQKKLDLSMLKDAADADIDARASEDVLEELRDSRWDALPTVGSRVENLNRRVRRLEAKAADGVEAKAKKAVKIIVGIAMAVGVAAPQVERFLANYRSHGDVATLEKPSSGERLTIDRVQRPDGGAH